MVVKLRGAWGVSGVWRPLHRVQGFVPPSRAHLRIPMGVVEDATVTIGNKNFPIDFVVVDMPTDTLCPIIFGRKLFE